MLLYRIEDEKIGCYSIQKEGKPVDMFSMVLKNVNMLLKEENRLILSSNAYGTYTYHMVSRQGKVTLTFEADFGVTVVDNGFLKKNLMYFTYNGHNKENTTASNGLYLIDLDKLNLNESLMIKYTDDCVQNIIISTEATELFDNLSIVNKIGLSLTVCFPSFNCKEYQISENDEGKFIVEKTLDVNEYQNFSTQTY